MSALTIHDFLAMSQALEASGRADENVALLEDGVRRFPTDPELRILLASALLRPHPKEALHQIAEAISLDVDDARRVTRAAFMLYDLGEIDGARQYVAHAMQTMPPDDPVLEVELAVLGGQIAAQMGEADIAEEAFRAAVASYPEVEQYWVVLSEFLAEQGRVDEARFVVRTAIRTASQTGKLDALRTSLESQ